MTDSCQCVQRGWCVHLVLMPPLYQAIPSQLGHRSSSMLPSRSSGSDNHHTSLVTFVTVGASVRSSMFGA